MAITHPKSAPFQNEGKVLNAKELYLTTDSTVSAIWPYIYLLYTHWDVPNDKARIEFGSGLIRTRQPIKWRFFQV